MKTHLSHFYKVTFMTTRIFKSRLLGGSSIRAALLGTMAVAGIMAGQAVANQASASLNGAFSFDGSLGTAYVGTSLKTATDVILSATQNLVFSVPPTVATNGLVNNFYSPPANTYSVLPLSYVDLATGNSGNSMPVVPDSGFPLYSNFLTFSFTSPNAAGTTPNGRFTYSISDIVWEPGLFLNTLNFESSGFINDSAPGGVTGQLATLSGSFHTTCPLIPVVGQPCNAATVHFDFETLGDGHYQSVPEPVSMSLLGIGIAGLAAVRRRRT